MPTPPALRLTFSGRRVDRPEVRNPFLAEYFETRSIYDLKPEARGASQEYTEELGDEIVELETDDGVRWIGFGDDLPDVVGRPRLITEVDPARGAAAAADQTELVFRLPSTFRGDQTRGLFGDIFNKTLRVLRRAAGRELVAEAGEGIAEVLGRRVDEWACPRPGLHLVSASGELTPAPARAPASGRIAAAEPAPALLFIHGTASSFAGGFGGIGGDTWRALHETYAGRVYAFDHYTVTHSPVRNALDLWRVLPQGLTFDLVTHSRGGLVGDVLARCDARLSPHERGYTAAEQRRIREDFEGDAPREGAVPDDGALAREIARERRGADARLATEMAELTRLATERGLTVRRIVRVASPAAGTTLLSERLDHFLNAVFNLLRLGAAQAPALLPLAHLLEAFTMAVVSERKDPATFPGLYAMVPEGGFAAINNLSRVGLPSMLISVAGDSEVGGGPLRTLAVMLSNLLYHDPNDFVVDTASMSRGLPRRGGHYVATVRNAAVDHFRYFSVAEHLALVTDLLAAPQPTTVVLPKGVTLVDRAAATAGTRGIAIDALYDPGEVTSPTPLPSRPIAVLLPGIMGSNLAVGGDLKWVDLSAMMNGAVVNQLHAAATDVEARSAIDEFYGDLVRFLASERESVEVFAYDWRLSLATAAAALRDRLDVLRAAGQPIRFLAHSMGGLVVRQYIIDHYDHWTALRREHGARVVLLGTPWAGSHLITEVITGHSARLRQLHRLSLFESKRRVLETVHAYRGMLELLPLDAPRLGTYAEWERLAGASGWGVPALPTASLEHVRAFRERTATGLARLTEQDYAAMVYVAGQAPATVDGYEVEERRRFPWPRLRYTATAAGDGSVTWARGIPEGVRRHGEVYYVAVEHGLLCAKRALFPGLLELLREGHTREGRPFGKTPHYGFVSAARDGAPAAMLAPVDPLARVSPTEALFGVRRAALAPDGDADPEILVEVFNGDLKWARFPVLVGHFRQLGIVSAERAVDRYLDGALEERYLMDFYPGEIGEQEVIVDIGRQPKGAIVVGLGSKDDLTGSRLASTVRRGLVKYAMFCRDNQVKAPVDVGGALGVSLLLVGTNFGEVPLRESLRNLLAGVRAANADIARFETRGRKAPMRLIRHVEFVDYYEDRAYEAYRTLEDIIRREHLFNVVLADGLVEGFGRRRRFLRAAERGWWQTLSTRAEEVPGLGSTPAPGTSPAPADAAAPDAVAEPEMRLRFDTYTRGTSVSAEHVYSNLALARIMARRLSHVSADVTVDNARASRVLFELLLPNAYKDFIRNHRNIAWRMDPASAAFPWELFYDEDTGQVPTFVRAGMVRQLISASAEMRPAFVRDKTALVIGDPSLEGAPLAGLARLAGASDEAFRVHDKLRGSGYGPVEYLDDARAAAVVTALFERAYKVIHIAAHGAFVPGAPHRTGVVLSDGVYLTPGMFRQLSTVPEFVFVNCCHLGAIDPQAGPGAAATTLDRDRLAANIGTQLIELGVRAVVVAGWAVEDAPAKVWADVFYDEILAGAYFGDAVRLARKRCYDRFPQSNTWGAYQCYGDQFYRLVSAAEAAPDVEGTFDLAQELLLELDNLVSQARATAYADRETLKAAAGRGSRMLARARDLGIMTTRLRERQATFELLTGDYPAAANTFAKLFDDDSGEYELRSYFTYANVRVRQATIEALLAGTATAREAAYAKIDLLRQRLRRVTELADEEMAARAPGGNVTLGAKLHTDKGSILKRMAAVAPDEDALRGHLRESAQAYLSAAQLIGLTEREAIYHVCSYLQLTVLGYPASAKTLATEALGETPAEWFARWADVEAYMSDERDSPYAALRQSNLMLTRAVFDLLRADDGADAEAPDLDRVADGLIAAHREQQGAGFNLRDLRGQIEHYDLLLCLCQRLAVGGADQAKQLRRVRGFLHGRLVFPADSWRDHAAVPADCAPIVAPVNPREPNTKTSEPESPAGPTPAARPKAKRTSPKTAVEPPPDSEVP